MSRPVRSTFLLFLTFFASCEAGSGSRTNGTQRIAVVAAPEFLPLVSALVAHVPGLDIASLQEWPHFPIVVREDPTLVITRHEDVSCADCYRLLNDGGKAFFVQANDALGAQYGTAHLLEIFGYRFFHPFQTHAPGSIRLANAASEIQALDGHIFEPDMKLRGLHLHTLHPIEGLHAFWMPSDTGLDQAKRIIDWTIKNRGNYIQWVALDDIQKSNSAYTRWKEHTRQIVDYAHARGVQVGMNPLLFGASSFQNAFVLSREGKTREAQKAEIRESVRKLVGEIPLDVLNLSFGEFVGSEPQEFIDQVNDAYDSIQEVRPGIDVTATVHVGNFDNLRVSYKAERQLFYFLVQYTNPKIVPWVHSVMYYNLFDDAGGAYKHDDFSEHREFLLKQMREGRRVAYFPETAYWIAFDNSVPTYLPLYVYSRWIDMKRLREASESGGFPPLREHVVFSSGWEWGYWQNDYASLRMNYALPGDWRDIFREMFQPMGRTGRTAAEGAIRLAEIQHEYLIEKRLAPYFAGRDFYIDLGRPLGVFSQPDRITFSDIAGLGPEELARLDLTRSDLAAYAQSLGEIAWALSEKSARESPWLAELRDGILVDAARASFARNLYDAAVSGDKDPEPLRSAERLLEEAEGTVRRRHTALFSPDSALLIGPTVNPTIYPYGYLKQADTLCYWRKELIEAGNVIFNTSKPIPQCVS